MNIVQNFFGSRPTFQTIKVGDVDFDIVSLSKSDQEAISACESYAEMLNFAADNGLAYERERIVDGDMVLDIPLFWSQDVLKDDGEPTIKEQVGAAICGISNLSEVIGQQALLEKPPEDDTTFDTELADLQVSEHPQSIS